MTSEEFENYKDDCLEDISALQDDFIKLYDIESYENWYYNNDIGAFDFKSDDGRILYFKHVHVGSYSTKANTWKWAWDNKNVPKHVSRPLQKVKSFGQTNNCDELTTGLINGNEYTGWAMTAISAKLLNAIGAYRVPQENLFIYFIFTNEFTQEEYDSLKDKYIACDMHISGRVAFICQHLNKDTHTGFHEAFDPDTITYKDDGYQAWCDKCEKVRLKEGGWNDTSMAFAKIKLVCDQCFFEIRKRNLENKK
jgi:hypothetical protein